jgi:hypothetical protein
MRASQTALFLSGTIPFPPSHRQETYIHTCQRQRGNALVPVYNLQRHHALGHCSQLPGRHIPCYLSCKDWEGFHLDCNFHSLGRERGLLTAIPANNPHIPSCLTPVA